MSTIHIRLKSIRAYDGKDIDKFFFYLGLKHIGFEINGIELSQRQLFRSLSVESIHQCFSVPDVASDSGIPLTWLNIFGHRPFLEINP